MERGAEAPHIGHAQRITLGDAEEAMQRILKGKKRPTAALTSNHVMAIGAMVACRGAGVKVPQDISITRIGTRISAPLKRLGSPRCVRGS